MADFPPIQYVKCTYETSGTVEAQPPVFSNVTWNDVSPDVQSEYSNQRPVTNHLTVWREMFKTEEGLLRAGTRWTLTPLNSWEKQVVNAWIEEATVSNPLIEAGKAGDGHCRISAICGMDHLERNLRHDSGRLQKRIDAIVGNKDFNSVKLHSLVHRALLVDFEIAEKFIAMSSSSATCLYAADFGGAVVDFVESGGVPIDFAKRVAAAERASLALTASCFNGQLLEYTLQGIVDSGEDGVFAVRMTDPNTRSFHTVVVPVQDVKAQETLATDALAQVAADEFRKTGSNGELPYIDWTQQVLANSAASHRADIVSSSNDSNWFDHQPPPPPAPAHAINNDLAGNFRRAFRGGGLSHAFLVDVSWIGRNGRRQELNPTRAEESAGILARNSSGVFYPPSDDLALHGVSNTVNPRPNHSTGGAPRVAVASETTADTTVPRTSQMLRYSRITESFQLAQGVYSETVQGQAAVGHDTLQQRLLLKQKKDGMKGINSEAIKLGIQPSQVLDRRIVAAARDRYAPNASDEHILKTERAINGIASIDAQAVAHGIQPSQVLDFNIIGAARHRYAPDASDEHILKTERAINGKAGGLASINALGARYGIQPSQVLDLLFVAHARRVHGFEGTDAEVRKQSRNAIAMKVLETAAQELGIAWNEVLHFNIVQSARDGGDMRTDKEILDASSAKNSREGHANQTAALDRKRKGEKPEKNDHKAFKARAKMAAGGRGSTPKYSDYDELAGLLNANGLEIKKVLNHLWTNDPTPRPLRILEFPQSHASQKSRDGLKKRLNGIRCGLAKKAKDAAKPNPAAAAQKKKRDETETESESERSDYKSETGDMEPSVKRFRPLSDSSSQQELAEGKDHAMVDDDDDDDDGEDDFAVDDDGYDNNGEEDNFD